jgi:hypothetical protein
MPIANEIVAYILLCASGFLFVTTVMLYTVVRRIDAIVLNAEAAVHARKMGG